MPMQVMEVLFTKKNPNSEKNRKVMNNSLFCNYMGHHSVYMTHATVHFRIMLPLCLREVGLVKG